MLTHSWERCNPLRVWTSSKQETGMCTSACSLPPPSHTDRAIFPVSQDPLSDCAAAPKAHSWRNVVTVEKEVLCKSSFKSYPGRNQIDLGILSVQRIIFAVHSERSASPLPNYRNMCGSLQNFATVITFLEVQPTNDNKAVTRLNGAASHCF